MAAPLIAALGSALVEGVECHQGGNGVDGAAAVALVKMIPPVLVSPA
jgi:hypothetical protein